MEINKSAGMSRLGNLDLLRTLCALYGNRVVLYPPGKHMVEENARI